MRTWVSRNCQSQKLKISQAKTTLITNYLDHIMREMLHDPDKYIVEWPNTEINERKARKPQGSEANNPISQSQ